MVSIPQRDEEQEGFMGSKVLVTGGCGFIGSFVTDAFISQGIGVNVLDNLDPQVHPKGLPSYFNPQAQLIRGDIRDTEAVDKALEGVDRVVHCAGAVGVGQSMYQIHHYIDVNVTGTALLLQKIIDRSEPLKKLVVYTSMTGYGEGLYRRPSDGELLRPGIRTEKAVESSGWEPVCPESGEVLVQVPITEEAELQAKNIYALSKRYQEQLCLEMSQAYDFPVTCLRLFNVYGPRQSLNNPYTGVLAIFLGALKAGKIPRVYEDGLQTRDFVSVHDVVRATMLSFKRRESDGSIMNIGTGIPRSIMDIAKVIARLSGYPEVEPEITGKFRTGDIRHCSADISRARDLLGYEPSVDWEESLEEIIRWSAEEEIIEQDLDRAHEELRQRGLVH